MQKSMKLAFLLCAGILNATICNATEEQGLKSEERWRLLMVEQTPWVKTKIEAIVNGAPSTITVVQHTEMGRFWPVLTVIDSRSITSETCLVDLVPAPTPRARLKLGSAYGIRIRQTETSQGYFVKRDQAFLFLLRNITTAKLTDGENGTMALEVEGESGKKATFSISSTFTECESMQLTDEPARFHTYTTAAPAGGLWSAYDEFSQNFRMF